MKLRLDDQEENKEGHEANVDPNANKDPVAFYVFIPPFMKSA